MSTSNQVKEQCDDTKPLWNYVSKIKGLSVDDENFEVRCSFCEIVFNGSYTGVRAHLLKIIGREVRSCQKITPSRLAKLTKMHNEAALRIERPKKKLSFYLWCLTKRQPMLIQKRERLLKIFNYEIAKMFYYSGLPFYLARNPHYRKTFSFAANNNCIFRYQPPGYNKLRTTLFANERRHVENLLQPIKNTWKEKGVSIVNDGWSDPQRIPLINFMVVIESGPMFLKALNCSVEAAGLIIEAEFPSIYWTPCVMHTLNLALKNICAAKNTKKIMRFMKNVVGSHILPTMPCMLEILSWLLALAPIRFASTIVMLKRFKHLKKGFQEIVISEQWSSYKEDDINKEKFVKETILDDIWWDKVDCILSFTTPIYDVLRKTVTDAACLHLVYEMWDSMIENVKKVIYRHKRMYFDDNSERRQVNVEFANFSSRRKDFDDIDSLRDRSLMEKLEYLLFHSFNQKKQDDTSSVEDQVFVHSNLRFLSRNSLQYHQEEIKIWDIAQDEFG
ncbi:hypothetical protein GmHk_10G028237 [Glycine max]|nr:hypothetical protein GmHk_10G028237 [Glycine max]